MVSEGQMKKVFGSDSEMSGDEEESENGVRKSSRIKSILKQRKKDEFLEGAEESDFYPLTKMEVSKSNKAAYPQESFLKHISTYEDDVEGRPLNWLVHHEKLLDLGRWVTKLSGNKKNIAGWKYEVYYKQKEGDKKYGLMDTYFVSNKEKKMRTRREVAYYLNLNLSNRNELSRGEVFKYAFHKNLDKMEVQEFPSFDPEDISIVTVENDGVDDDTSTVSEYSDLEEFEKQFLSNEDIHKITALENAAKLKLNKEDAMSLSKQNGTLSNGVSSPAGNHLYEVEINKRIDENESFYKYFLKKGCKYLEKSPFVLYDLQGKAVKGCKIRLKNELVYDDTVVVSLGYVLNEKAFHGENFIYPVGYTSKSKFLSRKNFTEEVFYTNQIKENLKKCWKNGGKKKKCGPVFIVTDDVGNVFKANSPTEVWRKVIQSFIDAFNEKCRKIATVSELLYSCKNKIKRRTGDENIKRKVRHILTGMVTRLCNKQQKLESTGEDTFDEFAIDSDEFHKNKSMVLSSTKKYDDSDGEGEDSWWKCNVDYTLRGDLGRYLFGLDRLEVRCILEGLPGVSVCCPKYVFIVQRDSYKKSFNVKATKKIASNTSRLQRGFSKIRKHVEIVEKRAEVANKRFMRLEDDIKKRKLEKDLEEENYKSFTHMVNKKLLSDRNKNTQSKKALNPTEQKQLETLEKTKQMVSSISVLSRSLGDFFSNKFLTNLDKDESYFAKNNDIVNSLSTYLKSVPSNLIYFNDCVVNERFLVVANFINLFGNFLGLCPYYDFPDSLKENISMDLSDSLKTDVVRNTELVNKDLGAQLEFRRNKILQRESLFKKKKNLSPKSEDNGLDEKTSDEKTSDEKIVNGSSENVSSTELAEELNDEEMEEEEDEEDDDDEEGEGDDVEELEDSIGLDQVPMVANDNTHSTSENDKTSQVKEEEKKAPKIVLVETLLQRPVTNLAEVESYFRNKEASFLEPLLKSILQILFRDSKKSDSVLPEFVKKVQDPIQASWPEELLCFRSIPLNEYTLEEAIRFVLVYMLSPRFKVSLSDGTVSCNDSTDFLRFNSLSFSNTVQCNVDIPRVKSKNFNISRRGGKSKTLSDRQVLEKNKVDKYFEIKNLICKSVDTRILNLQDIGPLSRTPKNSKSKHSSRYDSEFAFIKSLSNIEKLCLPCWAFKLITVTRVKDTRLLRMKKILSEADALFFPINERERTFKSKLQEIMISSPVDMKLEIYRIIEQYLHTIGIALTGFTSKEILQARKVIRLVSSLDLAIAFCSPVNIEQFPDYAIKIKKLLDLQTIDFNLKNKIYLNIEEFLVDVRLMWANCMAYNPKKSEIHGAAVKLGALTEALIFYLIYKQCRYSAIPGDVKYFETIIKQYPTLSLSYIDKIGSNSKLPTVLWDAKDLPETVFRVTFTSNREIVKPRLIEPYEKENSVKSDENNPTSNKFFKEEEPEDRNKLEKILNITNSLRVEEKYLGSVVLKKADGENILGVCESYSEDNFVVVFPKSRSRERVSHETFLTWLDDGIHKFQSFTSQVKQDKVYDDKAKTLNGPVSEIRSKLLTKTIQDFSEEELLVLCEFLCNKLSASPSFRSEIDRRFEICIQTRKKWRMNPPIIKFRHPENYPSSSVLMNDPDPPEWVGKYPGTNKIDNLTDEVSKQLNKINNELWSLTHDSSIPLNRSLEASYNRVERELARCYKKTRKKQEEKMWKVELDVLLQQFQTRMKVIGKDRYYNKYCYNPFNCTGIFIQPSRQVFCKASTNVKKWILLPHRAAISDLIAHLNDDVKREAALKIALKRRLPIFERHGTYLEKFEEKNSYLASKVKIEVDRKRQQGKDYAKDTFKDLVWNCKSSKILPEEIVEEHFEIARKSIKKLGVTRETLYGRQLFSCKALLLNIEKIFFEARILKGNVRGWFDGKRVGWLNFVLLSSCFEDIKQALFFLEDKLEKERIEFSEWFEIHYGDCALAMRCPSFSSLCCRLFALDANLNYESLGKKKFRKRPGNFSSSWQKKKKPR